MNLTHFEKVHQNDDGIKLFIQGWMPDKKIKGVICLVHGLGEHGGRYSQLAQLFGQEDFSLITLDLHGHGRSGGKRGHISSYNQLMNDISILLSFTASTYPASIPVFLYGHSMGGNLVINYVLRNNPEISGLIVSSPWLKLGKKPSISKLLMGWVMSYVWPGFTQDNGIDKSLLTHCQDKNDEYIEDPLVHNRISAALFMETHRAGEWAMNHASQLKVPSILLHGTEDLITSPEASKRFAEKAGDYCYYKALEGYLHEIHNEDDNNKPFLFIRDWIKKLK